MGAWHRRRRRTIGGVTWLCVNCAAALRRCGRDFVQTSERLAQTYEIWAYNGRVAEINAMACSSRNDQVGGRVAVTAGNNGHDIQMRYGSEV